MKIFRALLSVSDKTGIASFARAVERQGGRYNFNWRNCGIVAKENVILDR